LVIDYRCSGSSDFINNYAIKLCVFFVLTRIFKKLATQKQLPTMAINALYF